ncbi:MAG: hypothetical protein ABSH20_13115 [Tepidisphaeraceae bacterium]|jgi:hypothetical protein
MANPRQTNQDPAPRSQDRVLRLAFWLIVLAMLGVLVGGRIHQQQQWNVHVNAKNALVMGERQCLDDLWLCLRAGLERSRKGIENAYGIKLKRAEPEDPPWMGWPRDNVLFSNEPWGPIQVQVLEIHVWLAGEHVVGATGLLRDDNGLLWGHKTDMPSMNIWDKDGRRYTAETAPTWLRLSVCKAPAWLVAIDNTARFAWIAWIPFGVLALLGRRPRLSVEIVLAAALAAVASAAMDIWLCGQPVSAAHMAPLYAGFPLSAFLLVWTRSRQAGRDLAAEPAVAAPVPDIVGDRPDWAAITKDVHCPLCGYNLRGLEQPRCPECGLQFRWVELFEAARTQHPYLYEHQPWWNIGAFLKTVFRGLNPGRFWRQLSPVHRIVARRILVYFLLCQVLVLAPMLAGHLLVSLRPASNVRIILPEEWRGDRSDTIEMVIRTLYADLAESTTGWWFAFALWPLVTLAVLMICQTTFRWAGVKPMHVVRTVVYAEDIIALAGTLTGGVCLSAIAFPGCADYAAFAFALLTLTMYPLLVLRLATACRCYLRIRHAWATALATQAVFLLGVALLRVLTWAR